MDDKIRKRRNKIPRTLGARIDDQVDKIVYKVMTNEGLEETISRAIKKALLELVSRYFLLVAFLILLILSMQVVMFIFIIKSS
jgi:hypothetical protein